MRSKETERVEGVKSCVMGMRMSLVRCNRKYILLSSLMGRNREGKAWSEIIWMESLPSGVV